MIGITTEQKLASLLRSIIDGEKDIELSRQSLAEQPDFEPSTAFKRIDRLSFGTLSYSAFSDFLRDNSIVSTSKDLSNLFKIYDSNADGRINYSEFLNIVLPKTSSSLRQLALDRRPYYVAKYEALPYETEWALARELDREINYIRKIELLKEDLVARYDFSNIEAFKLIDSERAGVIDFDNFYLFMKRNGIFVSESDYLSLLRRTDRDDDGRISYEEFVESLTPINPITTSSPVRESSLKSSRAITQSTIFNNQEKVRSSSPVRQSRTLAQSSYTPQSSSALKKSNLEYYDYLNESNKKSRTLARSGSPTKNETPVKSLSTSYVKNSTVNNTYSSPTKKTHIQEIEDHQLATALKEQMDVDRDLQTQLNELALRTDFNLLDAFRFFDKDGKGSVTKTEFKLGCNEFGLFPTYDEIYLVMRKYGNEHDQLMRYNDFATMLTPKDPECALHLEKKVPSYADQSELSLIFNSTTRFKVKQALNSIINNENASEDIRLRLNKRQFFSVYEAFKTLDKHNLGNVNLTDFKQALVDFGIYATLKDLDNLLIRYDKNQDGKVSYYDFVQEMTPKSPQKI
mmetsp:Transcript_31612/g.28759  ORF Transcript_31612/g.28759 Transcript_31612/m.28759 type:complete len:573 (-) Transcript_31612:843-2561(-)